MMVSMRWFAYALVLGLAACGSVNNMLPDGPPGDDVPDAANQPDARTTGPITVTVLTDYGDVDSNGDQLPIGLPRQGAQVFFIEPDATYTVVTTGGDGVARSGDVHAGTTAVVVRPQGATQYTISVFAALVPDLSITAGPPEDTFPQTSTIGAMTVNLPTMSGASSYGIMPSCWSSWSTSGMIPWSATVQLVDPCDRSGRTLVGVAYNNAGELMGYTSRVVDLNPGANITMNAFGAAQTFVANVSGVPAVVDSVYINGNYMEQNDTLNYFGRSATPAGGSAVIQAPVAPLGDRLMLHANFYASALPCCSQNRLYQILTGTPTTAPVDGSGVLPYTTPPTWDSASRTVTWEENGPSTVADLVFVRGSYHVPTGDIYVNWRVIGPHVATDFTLPDFPTEIRDIAPENSDGGGAYEVVLIDDLESTGYLEVIPTGEPDAYYAAYGTFGDSAAAWISNGNIGVQ
jgi:hypothetical protein